MMIIVGDFDSIRTDLQGDDAVIFKSISGSRGIIEQRQRDETWEISGRTA